SQRQRKPISALDRAAVDKLFAYRWPGNLRELSTVIHAAVALAKNEVLSEDLLLLPDDPATTTNPEPVVTAVTSSGQPSYALPDAVQRHIETVLQAVGGNKRRAARELGGSRATLDRELRGVARRPR